VEITIKDTNAAKSCVEQNQKVWELYVRKYYRLFLYSFLLSALIFGVMYFQEDHSQPPPRYFGLTFYQIIALVYVLGVAINLVKLRKEKIKFNAQVQELAKKHSEGSNEVLIQISENKLSYKSSSAEREMTWDMFSSYSLYKNLLFLDSPKHDSPFVINKDLVPDNQYQVLLGFVKSRLDLKK